MSDIFISYAREDRERAHQLAEILEQQKWTVWWDKVIPPGKKYSDVIAEQLASAKAVVVLWSPAAVASDWVKDEAQEGARRSRLVPAIIEQASIPYGYRQLQTADLSRWDGSASHPEMQALLHGIARLIDKPAVVTERTAAERVIGFFKMNRLAATIMLVAALGLGYVAYRFSARGERRIDPVNNQTPDNNRQARIAAAKLTADGLSMIDPGGNHAGAILMFNEAISTYADYADAYFYRGQSFVALRQSDRAVADFRKAITLSADEFTRQQALKFIQEIESPQQVAVKADPSAGGVSSPDPSVKGLPPPVGSPNVPMQAQVGEIFSGDKSARIAGTTRLILERKQDPAAVAAAIRAARANPANRSGVINTLVYLQSVDPAILHEHRSEIEGLFDAVKDNGPQTLEHIRNVQALLDR
jgi:tetratricopeptide (TPR) repeat protein